MVDESMDAKTARAAAGISHADEKRLAREFSPSVAWPTLALALMLPATFAGIVTLGLTRTLSLWACTPILGLVLVKIGAVGLGLYCWRLGRNNLLVKMNVLFAILVSWNLLALTLIDELP